MASMSFRPGSTHIAQVDFDSDTDTLSVTFQDGRTYDYLNVPAAVYRQFAEAPSAGTFFNRHVKQRYPAEER